MTANHGKSKSANPARFARTLARIDAENAEDPNREVVNGALEPKELAYARRMSAMLDRFAPEAPETVRLAVRCQHIRRWEIPRSSYPQTSTGYKAWRARLLGFHAEAASRILREAGYDEATLTRVAAIVRKQAIKRDPEAQLLEDVAALVFLEHYLAGFAAEHPQYDEEKLRDILRKTFAKMSARGRAAVPTLISVPASVAPLVLGVAATSATH